MWQSAEIFNVWQWV